MVVSDFGKYNTINYDTIFSQNVRIDYLDNKITGEYLDFSMMKNILIISKNVVYTNPTNILKADVIELDTITKNTKIFMHNSKDQVNIKGKTTEKLGVVGREKAIACEVICSVIKYD